MRKIAGQNLGIKYVDDILNQETNSKFYKKEFKPMKVHEPKITNEMKMKVFYMGGNIEETVDTKARLKDLYLSNFPYDRKVTGGNKKIGFNSDLKRMIESRQNCGLPSILY